MKPSFGRDFDPEKGGDSFHRVLAGGVDRVTSSDGDDVAGFGIVAVRVADPARLRGGTRTEKDSQQK